MYLEGLEIWMGQGRCLRVIGEKQGFLRSVFCDFIFLEFLFCFNIWKDKYRVIKWDIFV